MVALHDLCGDRVEIAVHAPRCEFLYRPLAVTEPFGVGEVLKFDLQQLTERCGASFSLDSIISVDTDGQRVTTHDGDEVDYDYLVVASGARLNSPTAIVPSESGRAHTSTHPSLERRPAARPSAS